ncbi:NADPH:quinone reductase [Streptomyces sp. 3213]|uniref:NADP-dependent oxidoreductase n=1 Tax=Streptomyces sp. 3213.3 TaxID=1855348 RepID=UPI000895579E|nr:NADP-dependent oxidoreductase [Streptomyces sp. 3213.3]SEC42066.1 NADPH:quinone reductase [Streptomyces sp. 3213] [Streptomyces sp. 3213.3]
MKAIQFNSYGGAEKLDLVDIPAPTPGPGEILIRVAAVGVNPIDWKIRSGQMEGMIPVDFPSGTGSDAAGTVIALGEGVVDAVVGESVFGVGRSTYAEEAVLTSWAPVPKGVSVEESAGWGAAVETAVRILDQLGLSAGQTVLVSGASGSVGTAVVQIAVGRGISVVGTASAPNQDYLASLGAIPVVYGDGLVARVAAAAPSGIDGALHISGTGVLPDLIEIVGDPSRVLSISDFAALELGAQVSAAASDHRKAWAEAAALPAFRLPVERRFTLAEAGAAQEHSAAGHAAGKTIILP